MNKNNLACTQWRHTQSSRLDGFILPSKQIKPSSNKSRTRTFSGMQAVTN